MSVDGQKPSFFTPTVNHDVAPFTPTVNHDVVPKAIESNPSEIDYDVTCILFYHGLKHDESSGYSSGDEENASGYSSEEEENAKFLMHREEYRSDKEEKETWNRGKYYYCRQYYCSEFICNDWLTNEFKALRHTTMPLGALLTRPKNTIRLSFLGSLDNVWRLLLEYQDCKLNKDNNPTDAQSLRRFHDCLKKKVNVKYYTIKYEMERDADDVKKLESIFKKWSSVIEKKGNQERTT